ncbi:MAG TPA: hypothetical protein VJI13_04810, partial [Candidatus Norongarragalinales archaeon]|nr:hypothetical protein [Candidatus Norongarragalinales archaeon]
ATGAASTPPVTAGTVQFTRIRASPAKDEKLLVTLDSNSDIDAQVWDGSGWSATTELTQIASIATRDVIDIGYERVSGDALLVWANTTTQSISFRVWNGSEFSAQDGLGIGTAGVTNRILDLFPQEGTDNIMLLLSDGSATPDLYAILWDGSGFNTSTQVQITSELDTTSDYQAYYGAWEEQSGDFNVYYGEDAQLAIFRRSFEGGAWTAPEAGASGGDGDIRFVRAAGFPGSDNQTLCWVETTGADINCQFWDGSAFQGTFNDNTSEAPIGRNFDIAPLLSTDGGFIGMYGDLNDDWYDFMVCGSASNCSSGIWESRALWSTTQLGGTDTRWGKMYEDPNNPGNLTLLGISQTAANGWYRARIYCDESACEESEPWTGFGATSSAVYDVASFAFDKHRITSGAAPVCGLEGTYYLNSTDGNFKVGMLYSDEDSSNAYSAGDNIIFCSNFNINSPNFEGDLSDYEIVFPKSFANNVDMYFDA